jgi:outer membrane protein assembly factor BamD
MKFLRLVALLRSFVLPFGLSFSLVFTLALMANLTSGCSSIENRDTSTPEGAFKAAEDFEKDERYEEAIAKYTDVKNKFPYSRFAADAELKIADLQFKREAYPEAQGAYQLFKEFHPKHPQSDYVTYRLALSYYNQLPSTIDRDLALADKAILYFDETANSYPNSPYAKEAKEKRESCLKMLAGKEMYIAKFYDKRKMYESALHRYETILKSYPNLGLDSEALYGAAKCSFETGEKDRGLLHVKNLYSQYPSSSEAKRAKDDFKKFGAN